MIHKKSCKNVYHYNNTTQIHGTWKITSYWSAIYFIFLNLNLSFACYKIVLQLTMLYKYVPVQSKQNMRLFF